MVPHPGEETTNHSKGKPESEWSTYSLDPIGVWCGKIIKAKRIIVDEDNTSSLIKVTDR